MCIELYDIYYKMCHYSQLLLIYYYAALTLQLEETHFLHVFSPIYVVQLIAAFDVNAVCFTYCY